MQPPSHFTCTLILSAENPDGSITSTTLVADDDEIKQHFAASLAPGTLLAHMLTEARHAAYPAYEPPTPIDQVLLSRLRTLIQHRLSDETLSVETLAAELDMSPRHLRRRLHALVDESPQQLLRRARVERAEMLLRCGIPSVKEVAHAVGYGTAEGLRRAFVSVRGAPPSEMCAARAVPGRSGGHAVRSGRPRMVTF